MCDPRRQPGNYLIDVNNILEAKNIKYRQRKINNTIENKRNKQTQYRLTFAAMIV